MNPSNRLPNSDESITPINCCLNILLNIVKNLIFFGLLFHREFWRWTRPIVYIPSIVQSSHRVLSKPFCLKALKSWLIFLFFPLKNFFNNFLPFLSRFFGFAAAATHCWKSEWKGWTLHWKWTEIWPEPRFFNWLLLSHSVTTQCTMVWNTPSLLL